jgi:hypothetical protein
MYSPNLFRSVITGLGGSKYFSLGFCPDDNIYICFSETKKKTFQESWWEGAYVSCGTTLSHDVTKRQSMDKAGARKANKTKHNKSWKQLMDIIYCWP